MKKEDFNKKLERSGLTQKEYDEICEFEDAIVEDIINLVFKQTLSLNNVYGSQFAATTVTAACLQACVLCILPFMVNLDEPKKFIDLTSNHFKTLFHEKYVSYKKFKESKNG